MALDGLANCLENASQQKDKVNLIRYADDFVITGISRELLEQRIKPAVEQFLKERGLSLSPEKTKITHIDNGFDFLGYNVRKYNNGKLLIKPAKDSIKRHLTEIRGIIKSNPPCTTENLIRLLNPKISGWANYFRQVVAYDTFDYIDYHIDMAIWHWCRRRHANKNRRWIKRRYFHQTGLRHRFFVSITSLNNQKPWNWYLYKATDLPIVRHIKIRADYHPYLPEADDYFEKRDRWMKHRKRTAFVDKSLLRVR